MESIKQIGNFSFVPTSVGTYAIHMSEMGSSYLNFGNSEWDSEPVNIAGVRLVPWGQDNDLPAQIRGVLEKNNLAPGILDRKTGLLYGQGPMLYRLSIENNERVQQWIEDPQIQEWLDSWDYKEFIRNAITEYNHLKGLFVRYQMGKGVRIGRPWVAELECLPSSDCRLEWPRNDSRRLADVKHILVGDFSAYADSRYKLYHVFDKWNPTAHESAVKYHCLRSFGRNFYALSSFYGSLPWMKDANALPEIISYLNNNMIAAAYIVHTPQGYWEGKRQALEDQHPEWTDARKLKEMEEMKRTVATQIADVMSGKRNVGKFFVCVDFTDMDGHQQSWKIEPIEMNIDKYIEALSKISRIADSSTTSGLGLNPSLANIIIDGKGDSGSQMLYALKLFYGADTQIPEEIALEAINDAIRINFPDKKGIFCGLYRKIINKEDNVTASSRATNQV